MVQKNHRWRTAIHVKLPMFMIGYILSCFLVCLDEMQLFATVNCRECPTLGKRKYIVCTVIYLSHANHFRKSYESKPHVKISA